MPGCIQNQRSMLLPTIWYLAKYVNKILVIAAVWRNEGTFVFSCVKWLFGNFGTLFKTSDEISESMFL